MLINSVIDLPRPGLKHADTVCDMEYLLAQVTWREDGGGEAGLSSYMSIQACKTSQHCAIMNGPAPHLPLRSKACFNPCRCVLPRCTTCFINSEKQSVAGPLDHLHLLGGVFKPY